MSVVRVLYDAHIYQTLLSKKKSLLEVNLSNSFFDTAELGMNLLLLLKFYKKIFNVELKCAIE